MVLLKFEGEVVVDFPSTEEVEEGLHVGVVVHEGEEDLPEEEGLEVVAPEGEVDGCA